MKRIPALISAFAVLGLSSCASYVVPRPGKITLEEAMKSVGTGLVAMREAQGDLRTGLIAADVQVVFNVTAKGSQNGKLYVEASPIPTAPVIQGKVGGEAASSYEAARGNQITIKLTNVMLADPSKTLLKDANARTDLSRAIRAEGAVVEVTPIGLPE